MTITVYSTDADIVEIRPNILSLGVSNWVIKSQAAFAAINRTLINKWYKTIAYNMGVDWRVTEFNPDLVDQDQIKLLSCYKTLELIYLHLMKDSPEPDGFEREYKMFKDLYNEELGELLSIGINYDWDADDTIAASEKHVETEAYRRLVRC